MSAVAIIEKYREQLRNVSAALTTHSNNHAFYLADFFAGLDEKLAFKGCWKNQTNLFTVSDLYGEGFRSISFNEQVAKDSCSGTWFNNFKQWAAIVVPRTNDAALKASEAAKEKRSLENEIQTLLTPLTGSPEAQTAVQEIKDEIKNTEKLKSETETKRYIIIAVSVIVIIVVIFLFKKNQKK